MGWKSEPTGKPARRMGPAIVGGRKIVYEKDKKKPKNAADIIGVEELLSLLTDMSSEDKHLHPDAGVHDDYNIFQMTGELPPEHDETISEAEASPLARKLLGQAGVIDKSAKVRHPDGYTMVVGGSPLMPEQVEAIHILEDLLSTGDSSLIEALRKKLKEGGFE
mgnify:CR=1 FL=1